MNPVATSILVGQCRELGMVQVQDLGDGTVQAELSSVVYRFAWDVSGQCAVMIGREPLRASVSASDRSGRHG